MDVQVAYIKWNSTVDPSYPWVPHLWIQRADCTCVCFCRYIHRHMYSTLKLKDACSLEEKLQPRQHIKKQRHYFANKGPSSQGDGFSSSHVWMTVKKAIKLSIMKAEHRRIDAFELWCWRRLLRVPWTAGRSNQSILKEISSGYSLEGLMLKLKLQYFGHLFEELTHWKRP